MDNFGQFMFTYNFDQKCIMFFLIPSQNAKILTPGSKKVPHWVCEIFDEKMAFLIFMMRYRQTAFFEKFATFSGYSRGRHFCPIQKPHYFLLRSMPTYILIKNALCFFWSLVKMQKFWPRGPKKYLIECARFLTKKWHF